MATRVTIASGQLEGVEAEGVAAFKGIPYAAPPVRSLRWRAPQPAHPWSDVRQATLFGSDCTQAPGDAEPLRTTPSEDCMFVNVWRPADAGPDAELPVLVWIHGGGFVGGGTSVPYYDGSAFARRGIVVVSLNYRLGRLGFFAHPALLAAEGTVGNFGYLDQIAALRWVRDNIAAFGGDSARVTLAGESAGGASVLTLLVAPEARGLFHRAVMLSGGGRDALASRAMTGGSPGHPPADQSDAAFARTLGVAGEGDGTLAALRAIPAQTLAGDLNLNALLTEALFGAHTFQGTPMLRGAIAAERPEAVLRRGEAARVPLIVGTTAVDLPLHFPPSKADPFSYFGTDADRARAAYKVPPSLDQQGMVRLLLSLGADMTMHEPARFAARQMTAAGNPAWLYRFTYTAQATRPASLAIGQTHAGEVPFLFDTLAARYGDQVADADRHMAEAFNTYVANFTKTGDPNGAGVPSWPRFDPDRYDLLNFSFDDSPVFGPDPRGERIALIERAASRANGDQGDAAMSPPRRPSHSERDPRDEATVLSDDGNGRWRTAGGP